MHFQNHVHLSKKTHKVPASASSSIAMQCVDVFKSVLGYDKDKDAAVASCFRHLYFRIFACVQSPMPGTNSSNMIMNEAGPLQVFIPAIADANVKTIARTVLFAQAKIIKLVVHQHTKGTCWQCWGMTSPFLSFLPDTLCNLSHARLNAVFMGVFGSNKLQSLLITCAVKAPRSEDDPASEAREPRFAPLTIDHNILRLYTSFVSKQSLYVGSSSPENPL